MENEDGEAEAECELGPYFRRLRVLYRTFETGGSYGDKR